MECSSLKTISLELKKDLIGNIRKKCYPIPEIPTTTISIEPTKLRKNQANGTPNDNPTRDMQNHDHIN